MYKLKEMILMLCFILSGALCYANGEARIEKEQGEGIPIEIIESGSCTGPSRGNSIIPTLNGHMAQSIMESVYGINEFTCPQVDFSKGDRGMTFSYSNEDLSKAMGLTCSTSPNPATTWVNVDFTLPSNADRATLIVSNALGIKVAEYELAGNTGQKVLDLRALANGVYTCTLICGKYQCTNKLVITK